MREAAMHLSHHWTFNAFILLVVITNSLTIGMETYLSINAYANFYLEAIDCVFFGIYIFEISIKMYALHFHYFKSGWNVLDFGIVTLNLLVWVIPEGFPLTKLILTPDWLRVSKMLRVFRIIRLMRAMRSVTLFKSIQIILSTFMQSISAMMSIVCVSGVFIYIFGIGGTLMYQSIDSRFGSLNSTVFRLLQVMTLNRWGELYSDNKYKSNTIWFFLAVFIVLQTFIFLK